MTIRAQRLVELAFAFATAICTLSAAAAQPDPAIGPRLDNQTVGVLRVDLARIQSSKILSEARELLGADARHLNLVNRQVFAMDQWLDLFRKAGASEIFCLWTADGEVDKPLIVARPTAGGDAKQLLAGLQTGLPGGLYPQRAVVDGHVIAGEGAPWLRLQQRGREPRTDFMEALADAGDAPLAFVIAFSPDIQRVVAETLDPVARSLTSNSARTMVENFRSFTATLKLAPQPAVHVVMKTGGPAAAKAMQPNVVRMVGMIPQKIELPNTESRHANLITKLSPAIVGDRLELRADANELKSIAALLSPIWPTLQSRASRADTVHRHSRIGLALHMHHDENGFFPGRYTRDAKQTPLLSWRVHLLPFLDEALLYREFRLNEPWNSDHNKRLIAKMPSLYASAEQPAEELKQGLTRIVVPILENAPFSGPEAVSMIQITDGTSFTIAFLDAPATATVVWTKPDDLLIDVKNPLQPYTAAGLRTMDVTMCDGSCRRFPTNLAVQMVLNMLQMNDGRKVKLPPVDNR